mgnify:CR=1 FL=1
MLISPDEIKKSLEGKGWNYSDKKIIKTFEFETYLEGISFVNNVANLAEKQNHHPDINIGWCKVIVSISSHNLAGVTTQCVNLATGIDLI